MSSTEKKPMGVHVGSATLVMVFAIICLTIFAVLSVITANNGKKLAEKAADSVTNYYAADGEAVALLEAVPSAPPLPSVRALTLF